YGGLPDTRLPPRAALARAYRHALRGRADLLGYGDPRGEPRLREALAQMLRARRGLSVNADDVLVTRGSQMALALLGQVLVRPGERVAIEAYGYPPAWRALTSRGATLVPIPVDAEGLDVAALARAHDEAPIRAVYVTPHHQYPTTVTMSAARRMALLALARRERFAVIEDDYDHEFHYSGRPVLPLASADEHGNVMYVGTLSKVVAPGLRIGYLVAPGAVQRAALAARFDLDRQGDRVGETALAELIEDGELQRHLWRMRRTYAARRDHFVSALRDALGDVLEFEPPPGGMALWVRADRKLDIDAWHAECARRGVLFQLGKPFRFDKRDTPHGRFGYGILSDREIPVAVARLRDAARAVLR
ncbi:MAG TPA: PLP-dependent aminotransferase family protein, partial [Polyangiales bacterium]|nr:PLP-dependent aminotransferase family protein [Polyangiales bacterium]